MVHISCGYEASFGMAREVKQSICELLCEVEQDTEEIYLLGQGAGVN